MTKSNEDPTIRILKSGSCPTLSGKSKLGFNIGCKDKSDIWFRVVHNSSSGSFCDSWVSLRDIQQVFDKNPRGEVLTGYVLQPLFRSRSQNSPFFLFAVLMNEGLVEISDTERRCYQRVDPKQFMAKVQTLIAGKEEGKAKATTAAKAKGGNKTATAPTKLTAKTPKKRKAS